MRRTSRCKSLIVGTAPNSGARAAAAVPVPIADAAKGRPCSKLCNCCNKAVCPWARTATVSTTGQPSSACRRATSICRPLARATSAIFSATTKGRPRALSSSTKRKFMRILVASTTATSTSGSASPTRAPSSTSRMTCSSGVAGVRLYAPGKSSTASCVPSAKRAWPSLRSTVTPA